MHRQWKITHKNDITKLTRIVSSQNDEHDALEEIFASNNMMNNGVDMRIFTPMNFMSNMSQESENMTGISNLDVRTLEIMSISTKTKFIEEIIKIEKSYSPFTENNYYSKECLSANVKRLARAEKDKGNHINNAFYMFISEQMHLHNTPIKKLYAKESFALACGLQLHSCSSNHYDKIREKCNFLILPDKRTLFLSGCKSVPLDIIFSSKQKSGHAVTLQKICHKLSASNCKNNTINQKRAMPLHLDEINIKPINAFSNKCNSFGPSHNKCDELASSVQAFLLSTLTGKKTCLNLNSVPVHNMESECLEEKLLECLDKAHQADFDVIPIIIDGESKNVKMMKKSLRCTNVNNNNRTPSARMKFEGFFIHKDRKYFVLFCLVHIAKCVLNNLLRKDNYFEYPMLVLTNGCILESRTCSSNWLKELCNVNKNKLVSSVRLNKNAVVPSNLDKQKVAPALAIFSSEVTSALKLEFGEKAKRTHAFLEFFNNCIIQSLLLPTLKSVKKICAAFPFYWLMIPDFHTSTKSQIGCKINGVAVKKKMK